MFRAPRLTALRLVVAASLGGALGATGCTSLLGIDGKYTELTGVGGTADRGDGSRGDGGEGGTGAGGESVENGGTGEGGFGAHGGAGGAGATPGAGGGSVESDASAPKGTGGVPQDPVGCQRGKYAGTVNGLHSASFTFVGVPLGVSGPITFTLASGSGDSLQIQNGKIDGSLARFGPFSLTVDGTYDCKTHMMAGHLGGKVNGGLTSIDGTLTGDLLAAKDTARPWEEHEDGANGMATMYTGSGTWNAAFTGP